MSLGATVAVGTPVSAQTGVSAEDIAVRDQLIADQENLLNTYRCQHNIDTQLVPNGCPDTQPTEPPPSGTYNAIATFGGEATSTSCAIRTDGTVAC